MSILTKKLTNSSFMPTALCALSLVISAAAVISEFVGRYTYKRLFGETAEYIVTDSSFEFFESYSKVIILFVVSALFFIMQVSSLKAKRIGGNELFLTLGISLLTGIFSGAIVYRHASNGAYLDALNLSNEAFFIFLFREGIEWATVVCSLLLVISTVWLIVRLQRENQQANNLTSNQTEADSENGNNTGLVLGSDKL